MASKHNYGLADLVRDEGFDTDLELAQAYHLDSLVPAICRTCGYSTHYEPDQDAGWCEVCETGTCVSALVLMGII
jgi:hypothetical protein